MYRPLHVEGGTQPSVSASFNIPYKSGTIFCRVGVEGFQIICSSEYQTSNFFLQSHALITSNNRSSILDCHFFFSLDRLSVTVIQTLQMPRRIIWLLKKLRLINPKSNLSK